MVVNKEALLKTVKSTNLAIVTNFCGIIKNTKLSNIVEDFQ